MGKKLPNWSATPWAKALLGIPNYDREKVTIYIISTSVDPRDLDRTKDYNVVNNYILKPLSPEDLQRVLEKAVQYLKYPTRIFWLS